MSLLEFSEHLDNSMGQSQYDCALIDSVRIVQHVMLQGFKNFFSFLT